MQTAEVDFVPLDEEVAIFSGGYPLRQERNNTFLYLEQHRSSLALLCGTKTLEMIQQTCNSLIEQDISSMCLNQLRRKKLVAICKPTAYFEASL